MWFALATELPELDQMLALNVSRSNDGLSFQAVPGIILSSGSEITYRAQFRCRHSISGVWMHVA